MLAQALMLAGREAEARPMLQQLIRQPGLDPAVRRRLEAYLGRRPD
jgi:hypothetical protein